MRAPRIPTALLAGALLLPPLLAARPLAARPLGAPGQGPAPASIPLECRLAGGAWQRCQMQVERIGEAWVLLIGDQRFAFRHDGSGAVTLEQDGGQRRRVNASWQADASLCWDGVCARGEIPLD